MEKKKINLTNLTYLEQTVHLGVLACNSHPNLSTQAMCLCTSTVLKTSASMAYFQCVSHTEITKIKINVNHLVCHFQYFKDSLLS